MVTKKTWSEFQDSGMLYLANSILHFFGWAIVFSYDDDEPTKLVDVYPARVKFRGFSEDVISRGHQKVGRYLKENADQLAAEANDL